MKQTQMLTLLDGALGSALMAAGMPAGVCPEAWILSAPEHERLVCDLQRAYLDAGSELLYTPTFGANRAALEAHALSHRTTSLNLALGALTRRVADESGRTVLVAGDLSQTGKFLRPLGDLGFEELVDIYREQVRALSDFCDCFVAETLLQLCEARAALFAVREICPEKPFFASFSVAPSGKTLAGTDLCAAALSLWSAGASAVGVNCAEGPAVLAPVLAALAEVRGKDCRILAKPNAGLPDEHGAFSLSPEVFAEQTARLADSGADFIGGCCGTTPAHIAALNAALCGRERQRPLCDSACLAASERAVFDLKSVDFPAPLSCDETLSASLDFGAAAFSLFVPDEAGLCVLQEHLPYLCGAPLCLSAKSPALLCAALRLYPGRAAVETEGFSISEQQKITNTFHPAKQKG